MWSILLVYLAHIPTAHVKWTVVFSFNDPGCRTRGMVEQFKMEQMTFANMCYESLNRRSGRGIDIVFVNHQKGVQQWKYGIQLPLEWHLSILNIFNHEKPGWNCNVLGWICWVLSTNYYRWFLTFSNRNRSFLIFPPNVANGRLDLWSHLKLG